MAHKHIFANTAGVVLQKGPTTLNTVVVNNAGSAWVLTLYDGIDTSGGVVAAISASNGGNYEYDIPLAKGLFVVAAGTTAGDATIVFD